MRERVKSSKPDAMRCDALCYRIQMDVLIIYGTYKQATIQYIWYKYNILLNNNNNNVVCIHPYNNTCFVPPPPPCLLFSVLLLRLSPGSPLYDAPLNIAFPPYFQRNPNVRLVFTDEQVRYLLLIMSESLHNMESTVMRRVTFKPALEPTWNSSK